MYTMIRLTEINGDSLILPPGDYRVGIATDGSTYVEDGEHLWRVKGIPWQIAAAIENAMRETEDEQ